MPGNGDAESRARRPASGEIASMTSTPTIGHGDVRPAARALPAPANDVDALIESELSAAVAALEGPAPLLPGMAGYHLGRLTEGLAPLPAADGASIRGKRVRPAVALLCCAAAGGDAAVAAPLAAAIELLHNFT